MSLSVEREKMVFAHGIEFDVAHQDHLLVLFVEHRASDDLCSVLCISLREELEGLGYAFGRF